MFNIRDILDAMDDCNFKKGIGPDGFDGLILND
jgi:hypothetical protein